MVVPPAGDDLLASAPPGWVDLRPGQFATWIRRAGGMVRQAEARRPLSEESESDVDWTGIGADDAVDPARFAAWVFAHEELGERIKR